MNQQDANYFQAWFLLLAHKLDQIISTLNQIQQKETQMALDLTQLQTAVQAETSADQSIAQQLAALSQQAGDLNALQTSINNFATQLQSNAASVVAAVNANTETTTTTAAPTTP